MFLKSSEKSVRFFIILVGTIFLAESMIMYLFHAWPRSIPVWTHMIIDPLLLVAIILPLLYFFSYRPLLQNQNKFRRIDRRLKRKNTLLEEILNGIQEGVGIVDPNENVVFCNPAYARIFDETPESLRGRNLREFIADESYAVILKETEKRKKGKISTYEVPIVTAKGNRRYIQVTVSPRLDRYGSFTGAFGVIADLTERRGIEDRLRKCEEQFKSIVEKASEAMITADHSGRIVFWNRAAEVIFGYTAEEAIGQKLTLIIPEAFRQAHLDGLKSLVETGRSKLIGSMVEVPGLKRDGTEVPLELSLVSWKSGEDLFFSSIIRDITERREAEEALRLSEERYRALFEGSTQGIIIADGETKELSFANPAMCQMLGYTEDEVSGLRTSDIIPREDVEWAMSEFEACARGEKEIALNLPCLRKNGTIFYNNVNSTRIAFGGRTNLVGFFQDITELKKLDGLKEEFISTVSHELRTPLTSIHGSLSMINKGLVGEFTGQAKKLLQIAGRNSERLKALVDDILDIQKLEAGKMEFDMKPLKLKLLIEQSLQDNEPFGKQFNVEFVMDEGEFDTMVKGDSQRLAQVMSNLLSNAAKFSPEGSSVEISVARRERAARVLVKDHGPGIPEEFQGRIFQKFAQAESIFNRETRGTGLGLSISKAIIEEHGGEIGFETEIDVGTTFYFELPEWEGASESIA